MKTSIFFSALIIAIIIFLSVYLSDNETRVIYKEGEPITIIKYDTVETIKEIEKPIYKTVYRTKFDTILQRDTIIKYIESSFKDSTESYLLNVRALSLSPVDSFWYDLTDYRKSVTIYQTDTLETYKIKTETNWLYVLGGVILGGLL